MKLEHLLNGPHEAVNSRAGTIKMDTPYNLGGYCPHSRSALRREMGALPSLKKRAAKRGGWPQNEPAVT